MSENGDSQKPLSGAVICGTGLDAENRDKIASITQDLGAVYKLDLTSDVTHLVVGSIQSEKYRHTARHRPDIQVLQPAWVFAVRDAWTADEHIDLNRFYEKHRLPTFHNLNICVTGFEDPTQRQWLQQTCVEHGASYHGDLTKKVTHLIAAAPTGAKYARARQWNLRVVSLKWFNACIERGMILNESAFDPLLREESQGKDAYAPHVKKSGIGKRTRGDQESQGANARRKMRRTASTRLNSQSQSMLDDMAGAETSMVSAMDDSWAPSVDEPDRLPTPTIETQPAPRPVLKSHSSSISGRAQHSLKPIFSGWTCLCHGHKDSVKSKVSKFLTDNGATVTEDLEVLNSADREWSALIVPSSWIATANAEIPAVSDDMKIATEWWVERCLLSKKMLDPTKDVFSRSMHDLSRDLLEGYIISTSGFGSDVRLISTVVNALGGRYDEETNRDVNVLIYKPGKDLEKPAYCVRRGIDVVGPDWLYQTLISGQRQHEFQHFLSPQLCDAIQQIIGMQIKAEKSNEAAPQNGTKRHPSQRLSETRKRTTTPALPMMRLVTSKQHVQSQPVVKPRPLEEVQSNSQDRPKTQPQPVPVPDITQKPLPTPSPDKENDSTAHGSEPAESHATNIKSITDLTARANEFLSELIARRQKSSTTVSEPRARRRGPLGRAASINSSSSLARTNTGPFYEDTDDHEEESELAPQPSQMLTYEAPVAEDHKRYLAKTMGMKFETNGSGRRVETTGTMRDAESLRPGHGHRPRAARYRDT